MFWLKAPNGLYSGRFSVANLLVANSKMGASGDFSDDNALGKRTVCFRSFERDCYCFPISGIIVVKKCLLRNLNVTSFNDNVGVIGAVRAGLVIQLKESLGVQNIMNKQEKICK